MLGKWVSVVVKSLASEFWEWSFNYNLFKIL